MAITRAQQVRQMLEDEILKVTASDANELHVVASILEINRD